MACRFSSWISQLNLMTTGGWFSRKRWTQTGDAGEVSRCSSAVAACNHYVAEPSPTGFFRCTRATWSWHVFSAIFEHILMMEWLCVMYIQKISTWSRNSTCLFLDEENKFPRSCMKLPHYFLVNSPWFPVRHSIQSIASARQRPAPRVWRGHFQMAVPVKCCDFLPIAGGKDPWTSRGRKLENSVTFKNRSPVGWTWVAALKKHCPECPEMDETRGIVD